MTVFHAADDAFLRLVGSGVGEGESCHDLAIHREAVRQIACPVDEGLVLAHLLIAEGQLAEGLMGEFAGIYGLQQVGRLVVVGALVVALGEPCAAFQRVFHREGLLVVSQGLESVVLLHQAVAGLNEEGEGIGGDGLHDLLFRRNLALGGEDRHKGEDEYCYFIHLRERCVISSW